MQGSPVTLGDLVRDDKLLWIYCCDCGHERDVNPATVPLPAETPVPEVGRHMKCSKCGSRKINTKPELYPGGVAARGGINAVHTENSVSRTNKIDVVSRQSRHFRNSRQAT